MKLQAGYYGHPMSLEFVETIAIELGLCLGDTIHELSVQTQQVGMALHKFLLQILFPSMFGEKTQVYKRIKRFILHTFLFVFFSSHVRK